MHFETFILTILFKNAKLNIKKKKKATQVFQNLGRLEKGKQTSFFRPYNQIISAFVSFFSLSFQDGKAHANLSANEILFLTVAYDWLLFG